jgi:hypothetical protein
MSDEGDGDPAARDARRTAQLLLTAADKALVNHAAKLLGNWMIESAEQPQRCFLGIRKAVNVWQQAVMAIREDELTS